MKVTLQRPVWKTTDDWPMMGIPSITSNLTKAVNGVCRLSDTLEEWEHPELKRRRGDTDAAVKLECDDANDAYAFRAPGTSDPASAPAPAPPDAPASTLAPTTLTTPVYVDFFLKEHYLFLKVTLDHTRNSFTILCFCP